MPGTCLLTDLSVHSTDYCSHYVAFIRKVIEGDSGVNWVLYNDEKVVKAVDVDEMKKFAYVYFFQRV